MSVDIHQLTMHLPPKEQEAVRRAYRDQAQNETAAFLWCFFLGIAGAHRFYLRQWGRGVAHLILFVAALAALVLGVALSWPPALTAGVVVPLLLIALLWMVVDLFGIDDEVGRHNLTLAERLTAGAFVADDSRGRMALDTLAAVERTELKAPEPVLVAVATAQDDSARAVAEALVATPESTGVGAGVAEPVAVRIETPAEPRAAVAQDDPQVADPAPVEVQTVTGIAGIAEGEGYRAVVADAAAGDTGATLEPEPASESAVAEVRTGWDPEAMAAAAAAAAASAAAFAPLFRSEAEEEPPAASYPAPDVEQAESLAVPAAEAASDMTWADLRPTPPAATDPHAAAAPLPVPPFEGEPNLFATSPTPAAPIVPLEPFRGRSRDLTDLGADVAFAPIADIEPESAYQVRIADLAPDGTDASEATLVFVPEVASEMSAATAEPTPASVWPAAPTWPAEEPTDSAPLPSAAPAEDTHPQGDTLAELAAFGMAGGAAALAWSQAHDDETPSGAAPAAHGQPAASLPVLDGGANVPASVALAPSRDPAPVAPAPQEPAAAPAPAPAPAPVAPVAPVVPVVAAEPAAAIAAPPVTAEKPHHLLKHIKVVRQVKVGDDIVEESFAEAYIHPDEDPEPVRQRLREQLRHEAEQRRAPQP